MKKLKYFSANFNEYNLLEDPNEVMVYACPSCIKKYSLYNESGMKHETVEYEIANPYDNGLICFIEGCNNMGAVELCLIDKHVKIT